MSTDLLPGQVDNIQWFILGMVLPATGGGGGNVVSPLVSVLGIAFRCSDNAVPALSHLTSPSFNGSFYKPVN